MTAVEKPFATCNADNRETPFVAIHDLLPLLLVIADSKSISFTDMQVYDPYYCEGARLFWEDEKCVKAEVLRVSR